VGAGFSAGQGYPVGASLLPCVFRHLRGEFNYQGPRPDAFGSSLYDHPDFDPARIRREANRVVEIAAKFVSNFFARQPKTAASLIAALGRINVAEFYTLAHTLSLTPMLFGLIRAHGGVPVSARNNADLAKLFDYLAAAVRTLFLDISYCARLRMPLAKLLQHDRPDEHVFISFNWDEEIEIELNDKGGDVSYNLERWRRTRETHLMLKPHGSIGWYDLKQSIGNPEIYYVGEDSGLPRSERRLIAFEENQLPVDVTGEPHSPLGCPPVITPPTFAKQFEYPEQQLIWQDVIRAATGAHEFVFLGYSAPPDDYLTRAAIRCALRNSRHGAIRALAVGRSMPPAMLANFVEIFGKGFTCQKNFLACDFAKPPRTLPAKVENALSAATI
jgi:hypothetical protein